MFGNILRAIFDAILGTKSPARLRAELEERASKHPERLNWQESIVDLMKLNGMDSSLDARKKMARDLGYTGALDGSADMNLWLKARLMEKLARRR